ncbi:rare lipoprotein A [Neolewinella xylanilytica]|uniref:Probable endolytic peptidoglycan transglycosylase RlpA n=1 Tax=Neolewinella xylanilytica TaxID=1514080 RepID=A0A2S6I1G9_9BACT|nr:septal ring lytic transglycosylase RlpA family protein [Neolewinella xylanilytica]PPK84785.1 rare lipoprotein A [Neolewinella xylanilytica]
MAFSPFPTRALFLLPACLLLSFSVMAQQAEGMASYYADRFHEKPTSTGEKYSKEAYTAASKDYPYGTRLEVTNVVSGQSVEVRVNDCGPHNPKRIIDLSRAAAADIGLLRMGVAKVRLRVLELGTLGPTCERAAWSRAEKRRESREENGGGPMVETGAATPPPAPTVPASSPPPAPPEATAAKGLATEASETFPEDVMLFGVQVGAFGNATNASALVEQLKAKGFADAWMAKVGSVHRVFTGKFYFQDEATALQEKVRAAGFTGAAARRVQ